jgi:hypothetical protein
MGKGRDKRRRKAKKQNFATRAEITRAYAEAEATLRRRDPPALEEPDAPVLAPLKPKPNLRSGAVAIPDPEPEDSFSVLKATVLPK